MLLTRLENSFFLKIATTDELNLKLRAKKWQNTLFSCFTVLHSLI